MGYRDRLPNNEQMERMLNCMSRIAAVQDEAWSNMSALEKQIAMEFEAQRTGKVFRTRFYKFATNTTSTGTKMDDNAGLVAEPSTDTVEGRDDYEQFAVFGWRHCNYERDSDGFARVTALKGYPNYKTTGAYDIGSLHMTFYWAYKEGATYYDIIMSDTPHPELGLAPFVAAVKADGTVMPYFIVSAYASVTASDSKLRSQHGIPAHHASHDNIIDAYASKGTGYWGAGAYRNTLQHIMLAIKYATKNSQTKFKGCVDFNQQPHPAVAETGVKRVLLASQSVFYAGCCVSVGDGTSNDRNNSACHNIVDRAIVKSVETVTIGNTNYVALNLDVGSTFNTTTSQYVSTMPCPSGESDLVIGSKDGSYLSNSDGRHVYRIKGVEYLNGQYIVPSDTILSFNADFSADVLCWPHGSKPSKATATGYSKVGTTPAYNSSNADYWSGDFAYDTEHGVWLPVTIGSGDSVGTGDRVWAGGNTASGLKEYLMCGGLWDGSNAGAGFVHRWDALSNAAWHLASAD